MAIIATAPVPGTTHLAEADTAPLPKLPAEVADLVARIDAGPLAPLPTCPAWCVEHVDETTYPGFGEGQWHIGERRQSARVFTGNHKVVDGRHLAETEAVTVYAEAYDPALTDGEQPGVYVNLLGKLSVEDAMDLATDILRCASELVAAEIAKARGGRR